jgi:dihydroorotase-like cyclic amidohydrolase
VVDLSGGETISAQSEFASAGFTPWEGVQTHARVERTLLRGETVFAEGTIAEGARGRFLPRPHSHVGQRNGERA